LDSKIGLHRRNPLNYSVQPQKTNFIAIIYWPQTSDQEPSGQLELITNRES